MSAISYNVCPITGISYSIKDDYSGSFHFHAQHPVTARAKDLFFLVEKKSKTLPKSYIAGAILLQLQEEALIVHTQQEPQWLRGQANEMLCSFTFGELIDLYWTVRNTKAGIISDPLRVNLTTAVQQGRYTVYDDIKAVGAQSVSAADMKEYIKTRGVKGTIYISSKKDLDILSCLKRTRKDIQQLYKELATSTNYDPELDIEIPRFHNELTSIQESSLKRVANYLWKDDVGCTYHHLTPKNKNRLVEILITIYECAIYENLIDMDSVSAKSYRIVRKHIEEGFIPHTAEVEL